ncbi:MAG: HYR domain-containing protein, partial [Verrucomicrobia bacterium]|nr:HYR domain-containing protein [Verrucomicrobiota bacterium]
VISLTYSHASGTEFPLGITTVTATAKDAANNTGTATFTVTVHDTTSPVVTPPADLTAEATSAAGAVVNYPAATASDAVGVTSLTYSHASGTEFPLGITTVTVTAKDAANNTDTATFTVTVHDTTPPVVTPPADLAAEATSAAGAVVNYPAATASDAVGVTSLTYSHASGAEFPLGITTVTVTAKDAANNTGTGSFTVTVTQLTPLQIWRKQYFGTTANEGDAADNADPNDNGIVNLLEYALGGDPAGQATGVSILPRAGLGTGGTFELSLVRYLDRNDITLTVQVADSPAGPWAALARSTNGAAFVALQPNAAISETGTGNSRAVTVGDIYPLHEPQHPRRFMRLQTQ